MSRYKGVPHEEFNSEPEVHLLSILFDWDEANLAHIAEHGVARGEAEEVDDGETNTP